jgi:drug/metabolite transporter (DMT)-like permease
MQILLKKSANRNYSGLKIFLNFETILGYSIFLIITFITFLLYRYIDLSTGVLLETSSFVFILILSNVFLKEKLNKKCIIGILFIVSGITIYSLFGGAL